MTPREKEILKLIATGKTNKEIALELNLSEHTVKTHRKSINRKLNSKNVVMMLVEAQRRNII